MSEEQLSALLAKFMGDAELREKLQGVGDLDAAASLAKEAGFDVSKADLIRYQAKQMLELSADELEDAELEGVAGGAGRMPNVFGCCGVTGGSTWGSIPTKPAPERGMGGPGKKGWL